MANIPKWLETAVFYQIYPQSFYDSNGDGIGDINGIAQKLDYIQSLGVNALWLNPCFVSPFHDAGYDVTDYYTVAPRYGTNKDLYRLFQKAHERGIRICLDLVVGHTSIEHPWFKASSQHTRNAYSDRYIWTSSVWDKGDSSICFVMGQAERDGNFATNMFYCHPALNYGYAKPGQSWRQPVDAPGPRANRREVRKIMDFWLGHGADGFRVDVAPSLVKLDPGLKETTKLWREMRHWLQKRYPEAVLIAEWGHPEKAISAGFHVDFMLHYGLAAYSRLFLSDDCVFRRKGGGNIQEFLDVYLAQLAGVGRRGHISVPSGNHDCRRLRSGGRTLGELKVIFTFLLTWPGTPFIYYGDEIGMRYAKDLPSKEGGYDRTGSRTPMQWEAGPNAGFSTAQPSQLYLPIDPRQDRPTVKAQAKNPASLLNHVRKLIALRTESRALQASGKILPLQAQNRKRSFAYLRTHGKEKVLVAINPASQPTRVCLDGITIGQELLLIGRGVHVERKGKRTVLVMKGVSYAVYRVCGTLPLQAKKGFSVSALAT